MMESMAQTCPDSNRNGLEPSLNDLKAYVERAAREGIAAHEAEAGIWHHKRNKNSEFMLLRSSSSS